MHAVDANKIHFEQYIPSTIIVCIAVHKFFLKLSSPMGTKMIEILTGNNNKWLDRWNLLKLEYLANKDVFLRILKYMHTFICVCVCAPIQINGFVSEKQPSQIRLI